MLSFQCPQRLGRVNRGESDYDAHLVIEVFPELGRECISIIASDFVWQAIIAKPAIYECLTHIS